MQNKAEEIIFDAIFFKATTTLDGGWRITFEVGCNEGDNISKLSKLQSALKLVIIKDKATIPLVDNFEI